MRKDSFNLDSDYVQTQALKSCGYSRNQIDIYLRAKHNYYDVHYAFFDVDGKKIVEKIKNGDIFADQLGGRWCEVSGNKIWVVEW